MQGYVYVLSNKSMPGLLKIGYSKHGGFSRARQLETTGVPEPFNLEFEIYVHDMVFVESEVHRKLGEHRYSKEFFKVSLSDAVSAILRCFISSHSVECHLLSDDEFVSPAEIYMIVEKALITPKKQDYDDAVQAVSFIKPRHLKTAIRAYHEWQLGHGLGGRQ